MRTQPSARRHVSVKRKRRSGAAFGSAFRVGARWNLGEHGVRRITGMFRRKFLPNSKWERIFEFGKLSKDVGLQVGELTLRKVYMPNRQALRSAPTADVED